MYATINKNTVDVSAGKKELGFASEQHVELICSSTSSHPQLISNYSIWIPEVIDPHSCLVHPSSVYYDVLAGAAHLEQTILDTARYFKNVSNTGWTKIIYDTTPDMDIVKTQVKKMNPETQEVEEVTYFLPKPSILLNPRESAYLHHQYAQYNKYTQMKLPRYPAYFTGCDFITNQLFSTLRIDRKANVSATKNIKASNAICELMNYINNRACCREDFGIFTVNACVDLSIPVEGPKDIDTRSMLQVFTDLTREQKEEFLQSTIGEAYTLPNSLISQLCGPSCPNPVKDDLVNPITKPLIRRIQFIGVTPAIYCSDANNGAELAQSIPRLPLIALIDDNYVVLKVTYGFNNALYNNRHLITPWTILNGDLCTLAPSLISIGKYIDNEAYTDVKVKVIRYKLREILLLPTVPKNAQHRKLLLSSKIFDMNLVEACNAYESLPRYLEPIIRALVHIRAWKSSRTALASEMLRFTVQDYYFWTNTEYNVTNTIRFLTGNNNERFHPNQFISKVAHDVAPAYTVLYPDVPEHCI